jgi:hypothetical protein
METFAHSLLVLFFIALRHLLQMPSAMRMTNVRLFWTTGGCAKTGGFPFLILTLVGLDLLGLIVFAAITIPIGWD